MSEMKKTNNLRLERIEFMGFEIEAVQNERGIWVSINSVCDSLGIDRAGQRTRLKDKVWAGSEIISLPDKRERLQAHAFIHIDSFPMWMATIGVNKVSPNLRKLLEGFQVKAAKVLADHFLGKRIPQTYIQALEKHLEDQKRIVALEDTKRQLEADNREMKPKADVADTMMTSKGAIRIGTFAKTILIGGKIMGQNRMFEYLRRSGILIAKWGESRNNPYQRYIDNGWFTTKLHVIDDINKKTIVPLITNKGILSMVQKMKNDPLFEGMSISVCHDRQPTQIEIAGLLD